MFAFWFSPIPLDQAVFHVLRQAGLQRHERSDGGLPSTCVLVIPSPDSALTAAVKHEAAAAVLQHLYEGYSQLQPLLVGRPLVPSWAISVLGAEGLQALLQDPSALSQLQPKPPAPDPMLAAMLLRLWDQEPALLDAYLALEQASGFGTWASRAAYLEFLQDASEPGVVVNAWLRSARQLEELQTQRDQAEAAAALARQQLHRIQEELEHFVLCKQQQDQLLRQSLRQQQRSLALLDLLNPELPA